MKAEEELQELRARLGIIHPEGVEPAFHVGQIVRRGESVAHVTGRSIDWDGNVAYSIGDCDEDGTFTHSAFEVPEAELTDAGLVRHVYNGRIIGLITPEDLAALHLARERGTVIGLAGVPADTTVKTAADRAGALEGTA